VFCTAFLGAGYLFVGWFRVLDEDRDDPERARVVDDRALVAMPSRYPWAPSRPVRRTGFRDAAVGGSSTSGTR
jgi:hypothetical protein